MNPSAFRNNCLENLLYRLSAGRTLVYRGWLAHGPGTTREVANKSNIHLLFFRPRTTELYQMGLITLDEIQPKGCEGRYRVTTASEFEEKQQQNQQLQQKLPL